MVDEEVVIVLGIICKMDFVFVNRGFIVIKLNILE